MSTGNADASGPSDPSACAASFQALDRAGCERDASARSSAAPARCPARCRDCRRSRAPCGHRGGRRRGRRTSPGKVLRLLHPASIPPACLSRLAASPRPGTTRRGPNWQTTASGSALSRIIRKCGRQSGSATSSPATLTSPKSSAAAPQRPLRRDALRPCSAPTPCGARPGLAQSGAIFIRRRSLRSWPRGACRPGAGG